MATSVCGEDPGTGHSPQLVHLILQRLRLLGQTGQRLVPLLQLRDLPLQLGTVQALVLPAVLQPGGGAGREGRLRPLEAGRPPGLLAMAPADRT